jgi:hypothetical protein
MAAGSLRKRRCHSSWLITTGSEQRQKIVRRSDRGDALHSAVDLEARVASLGAGNGGDQPALFPYVEDRARRRRGARQRAGVGLDHDETGGVGVGEWPPQHGVDDAEDRRVGADAERECQHDDGGIAGRPPEDARAVAGVAHGRDERRAKVHVAHTLLDLLDAADLDERGPSRVRRRETLPFVRGGPRLHVRAQLVVQVAFGVRRPPQRSNPGEDRAQDRHGYDEESSTRFMAVTTRRHVAFSADSCRRPSRVSR